MKWPCIRTRHWGTRTPLLVSSFDPCWRIGPQSGPAHRASAFSQRTSSCCLVQKRWMVPYWSWKLWHLLPYWLHIPQDIYRDNLIANYRSPWTSWISCARLQLFSLCPRWFRIMLTILIKGLFIKNVYTKGDGVGLKADTIRELA